LDPRQGKVRQGSEETEAGIIDEQVDDRTPIPRRRIEPVRSTWLAKIQ
jgi:hypothetical protein